MNFRNRPARVAAATGAVVVAGAATMLSRNLYLYGLGGLVAPIYGSALNPNEPGQWPLLPKVMTWTVVAIAMPSTT